MLIYANENQVLISQKDVTKVLRKCSSEKLDLLKTALNKSSEAKLVTNNMGRKGSSLKTLVLNKDVVNPAYKGQRKARLQIVARKPKP